MGRIQRFLYNFLIILSFLFVVQPIFVCGNVTCDSEFKGETKNVALPYKLAGIGSILVASAMGVCIPLFLQNITALQPETAIHFLMKAFAAGVILATGFIHILPDAFESLSSPCLRENPWGEFPFTGFVAMMSAIATLMVEALATGYHRRAELLKAQPVDGDVEDNVENSGNVHGPGLAIFLERSNSSNLIRTRIISQVLEMGIVVHSVIIGISLGTTQSTKTIKPLIAALSFHQFFEGVGLGGCIAQANLKVRAMIIMVLFFALTTPTGIAIGIMISKSYKEHSPTALIVQGLLNSASAGILIYMALVDLLAVDFMNPKLLGSLKLQLGASVTLLIGACFMSILAKGGGI